MNGSVSGAEANGSLNFGGSLGGIGSAGVGRLDRDEPADELDDDDAATEIAEGACSGDCTENDGRGVTISNDGSGHRMSITSCGGGGGLFGSAGALPSEPDRPRVMKLSSRSRFLPAEACGCVPVGSADVRTEDGAGREATESRDHLDEGWAASSSSESDGKASSAAGALTIGEPTSVTGDSDDMYEDDAVDADARPGKVRNCGDELEVDSVGSVGRCFRWGLWLPPARTGLIVSPLLLPMLALALLKRGAPSAAILGSATYMPERFSVGLVRSPRFSRVDEMDGKVA